MDRDRAGHEPILEEDEIGADSNQRQESILLSYCHRDAFNAAQKIINRINKLESSVYEACLNDFLLEAFLEKYAQGINHNAQLKIVEDLISVIPDRLLTVDNFTKMLCLVHLLSLYSSFFSFQAFAFSDYVNTVLKMNSCNITQLVLDKYFSFVCQKISEKKSERLQDALQVVRQCADVFSKDFLGLRLTESEDKKIVEGLLTACGGEMRLRKAVRQIFTLLRKKGDANFKASIREPWFKLFLDIHPDKVERLLYFLNRIPPSDLTPSDFKKLICLVRMAKFDQLLLSVEFSGINALFNFLLKKCVDSGGNPIYRSVETLVQHCDRTVMGKIENKAESSSGEDSDSEQEGKPELNENEAEEQKKVYEADLMCPITQDCFENPVTTSNGHAFEKAALISWIKEKGQKVDPLYNKTFDSYVSDVLIKKVSTAIHKGEKITEEFFYCPLSVDRHKPKIIEKPVIDLNTGITYEEKNYLSWCKEKNKIPCYIRHYTVEKILAVFKSLEPERQVKRQPVLLGSKVSENPASFFASSSDCGNLWRDIEHQVRAFVDKQWTYHTGISQILELKILNPVSYVQHVQGICKRRLQESNNSRNAFYRAASVQEFYDVFHQCLTLSANASPSLLKALFLNLRNLNQKYAIDCSLPQGRP